MVPIFQELHTEKPAAARHREGCISAILKLSLTAVPRTQWSTPETWCSRLFHRCIGRVGEGGDAYDVGTIRGILELLEGRNEWKRLVGRAGLEPATR